MAHADRNIYSKRPLRFRNYDQAEEQEKDFCEWIVLDYARDILGDLIYAPEDQRAAQFVRVQITNDGTIGYIILLPEKSLDFPAFYMMAQIDEGDEPDVLIGGVSLDLSLFVHPQWFVNGYVVFSMERDGKPSGILKYDPTAFKYRLTPLTRKVAQLLGALGNAPAERSNLM